MHDVCIIYNRTSNFNIKCINEFNVICYNFIFTMQVIEG